MPTPRSDEGEGVCYSRIYSGTCAPLVAGQRPFPSSSRIRPAQGWRSTLSIAMYAALPHPKSSKRRRSQERKVFGARSAARRRRFSHQSLGLHPAWIGPGDWCQVTGLPSESPGRSVTRPLGIGRALGKHYRPYKIRKPRPLLRAGDSWSWQAMGESRSACRTGRQLTDPLKVPPLEFRVPLVSLIFGGAV